METITYVITGRGARIKHINIEGTVLCPRPKATTEATGRFEKLPVCSACEAALPVGEEGNSVDESGEVEVHFSARVTTFMATHLAKAQPALAADLSAPRLVRNGRGYTAFTTTTRARAETLVAELDKLLGELESGERLKGLKGGMNFQPEAVAKGIEHITADMGA